MELKLNSGDVITIPDDCKAVIKGKVITVEKEVQEFKDGDFCVSSADGSYLWIYIYKSNRTYYSSFSHAIMVVASKKIEYNSWCDTLEENTRLATEEEKQLLLDVLHANGKDWDADKKQIVDYRWKPNYRELYYNINYSLDIQIDSHVWYGDALDEICFSNGNCFKTTEEAQKYADKFFEILKERKL